MTSSDPGDGPARNTARNPDAWEFLVTRRSRPVRSLSLPVPDRAALEMILTAAARSPDHGMLVPWRFIVLQGAAFPRLARAVQDRGESLGLDPARIDKGRRQFDEGNLAVAVIEVQRDSEKIPPIEQTRSASAVCLSLLNAALAAGWGANWLTGWAAHDAEFGREALGLAPNESIAGFIHIGTAESIPPERSRPDISEITRWVDE